MAPPTTAELPTNVLFVTVSVLVRAVTVLP